LKILRVVTLASATGKYGGPFDTSIGQARLISRTEGMEVTVLAGHLRDDMPVIDARGFELIGCEVHSIGTKRAFYGCMSWAMCVEIGRQVRQADVVHVSYARELIPLLAAGIAVLLRRPLVAQPHGMLTSRTSRVHDLVDIIARPLFRKARRVIALTDVEKAQLEDWGGVGERITVIGNPLPYVVQDRPRTSKPVNVFFIARLEPRKRVIDFVEARRIAFSRGWDEQYEVIGPDQGDGAAVIAAAASTPGLSYRGPVPASSIEKLLDNAGVFVLTSENEPWGNVLVAALAKEIPVVVTRSAALASEIEQNHLGIVVPDRDPNAVAEAVHRLLTTQWRTPLEVNSAKEFARVRFDQAAIGRRILSTYNAAKGSTLD
jgi:glycosyltransferase involved in cell wall biosynthesis